MKNIKLTVYIVIELFLILMARMIFINTGRIGNIAVQAGLENISTPLQNLYILQSILLFVPFLIFALIIAMEIIKMGKENSTQELQQVDEIQTVVEADEEEKRLRYEEQKQQEVDKKRQMLLACIDEKMKKDFAGNSKLVSENLLACLSKVYEITQAEIFLVSRTDNREKLVLSATYAFYVPEDKVYEFEIGEGLIGQVAKAGKPLYMNNLPQGYITVKSGLGESTPSHLLILPWKNQDGSTVAVLEIASFKAFDSPDIDLIESLSNKVTEFYTEKN
jgi:hypothetical protein